MASLHPPASSLQPSASSLQPSASSLQPPAFSLQPPAGGYGGAVPHATSPSPPPPRVTHKRSSGHSEFLIIRGVELSSQVALPVLWANCFWKYSWWNNFRSTNKVWISHSVCLSTNIRRTPNILFFFSSFFSHFHLFSSCRNLLLFTSLKFTSSIVNFTNVRGN